MVNQMDQKRLLKICCSEWKNASRDKRELSVCKELGMHVLVLVKGDNLKKNNHEVIDGFDVLRVSTRPCGGMVPKLINRFIAVLNWVKVAKSYNPDIISGHDLEGLIVGYLVFIFSPNNKRPKLIYDSHEYEIGRERNTGKRFKLAIIKKIEKYLIQKCVFSMVVSESIAQNIQSVYNLEKSPIVIRNTPNYWSLSNKEILNERKKILDHFDPSYSIILMYHGAIYPHRGIENMLRAMSEVSGTVCFILGSGDESYKKQLLDLCCTLSISERVLFHEAVPLSELYKFVGSADIGFAIMEPTTQSYFFSLPNKVFENIQSLTPVIVSNFPELNKLVNDYSVGLSVDPDNINDIGNAIKLLSKNDMVRNKVHIGLVNAKTQLCWEKEKDKLKEAYLRLQ